MKGYFTWRGRRRFNRPGEVVGPDWFMPDRPCVRVSEDAANKIRIIANRRGIAKKHALELVLGDLSVVR